MRNFQITTSLLDPRYLCSVYSDAYNVHYNPYNIKNITIINKSRDRNELETTYTIFVTFNDDDAFLIKIKNSELKRFCSNLKSFGKGWIINNVISNI
jgi:hypothetical protein